MSNLEKPEFFRRVLPEECISFCSEEGKIIFAEALATGHMNCYFKLAAQFRTQDEPAYCGLSTLVMILNALDVDPGVVWKGPWRWYHENMLYCSSPSPTDKRTTISMEQFASVADCNSLNATIVNTDSNSEEEFRQVIKEYSQRDDSFVVASYSRKSLEQNGDFDFSPVAGYHPTKDFVLLLDTARYKYPPYWIEMTSLFRAMDVIDQITGLPRGYIILRKRLNSCPFLLGTAPHMLPTAAAQFPSDLQFFLQQWTTYLCQRTNADEKETTIDKTIDKLLFLMAKLKPEHMLLELHNIDRNCLSRISNEYSHQLLLQLEQTHMFRRISQKIESSNGQETERLKIKNPLCDLKRRQSNPNPFCLEHLLTALLLSWPFCCSFQGRKNELWVGKILHDYTRQELPLLVEPLATEVTGLSHQLSVRLHLINLKT